MAAGAPDPLNPFPRPAFVSAFSDFPTFKGAAAQGRAVGMTGHRGILGGILYGRLKQAGIEVHAYPGNVNDAAALAAWFDGKRFSHFFHFAAVVPVTTVEADPLAAYRTNVIGTFDVCSRLVQSQSDCWLFHASSSHVYRPTAQPVRIAEEGATQPQTYYGVTKLAAEQVIAPLLTKLKMPFCIGRIFSFSHATQKAPYLVPSLRQRIARLKEGDTLDVSNPSSVRDIQDAETIIDAVLHLAARRAQGIVNIGTGEGLAVKDIALLLARALDRKIQVTGVDAPQASGSLIADVSQLKSLLNA